MLKNIYRGTFEYSNSDHHKNIVKPHDLQKTYAHIERKKSKCDYILDVEPTLEQLALIEAKVNEEISKNHDVSVEFMTREDASAIVDLTKLPENASNTLRIVRIGDYDACACIGAHVNHTIEIGTFKITSYSYADGILRLRWKLVNERC